MDNRGFINHGNVTGGQHVHIHGEDITVQQHADETVFDNRGEAPRLRGSMDDEEGRAMLAALRKAIGDRPHTGEESAR